MEWIFDNFQVVALIAIVIGSLFKKFLEAKAEERQARERMDDQNDGEIFDPEEWQVPEQPSPSVPPPLYRQAPPPLVRQAVPPALPVEQYEVDAVLKRQLEMQERLRQIRETKAVTTGGAAATSSRVSAAQSHAKPLVPVKPGLHAALRNGRELRRAVILREVLGPPVGLR